MGEEGKTVYLKVAEALNTDVGRGIARLGSKAREELDVSSGDVVKLMGKKTALAIVWPSHPSDSGEDSIRIDGILRQNSGVGLGDKVKVGKSETKDAKKIVLAPQQPVRFHAGFDQYVKKKLVGKPIVKGNILPIGVFGTPIGLVVSNTLPGGPLMITERTDVEIRTEPVKDMGHVPAVTYDDVGGLGEEVQKIREMVELPLRHPELFERLGIEPPKGVLMYGPPGTGKTLLAKAVANESDANFIYIGGPEVVSKYVGESEHKIRQLFDDAQKNAPSIIFIDEIDAIAPKREEVTGEVERRMVSQLLCVAPDTLIYTPDGPVEAKTLYEKTGGDTHVENGVEFLNPKNLDVYSFGKEGKIVTSKVKMMNKLTVPQTFEIKLDNGLKTQVSPIQRFLTVRNSALEWVHVTEIMAGDYVACPATLPRKMEDKTVDLVNLLNDERYTLLLDEQLKAVFGREYVLLRAFKHYLKTGELLEDGTLRTKLLNFIRKNKETDVGRLKKEFRGYNEDNVSRLVSYLEKAGCITTHRKRRNEHRKVVALPVLDKGLGKHILGISVFSYFARYVKKNYFVNPVTSITPELSELIGYVLSDGSLAKSRLNVSGKAEIVERVEYLVKNIFGFTGKTTKINEKYWRYDAAGQTIPAILNEIFGIKIGKKAYVVRAPRELLTASEDCVKAFIRAYADCDGSLDRSLRIFSRSKRMITDIIYLLSSLGFGASYSFTNGMHYCNLLGGNNAIAKYAAEIGSLREDRQAFFLKVLSERTVSTRIERVPNIQEAINVMRGGFTNLADGDYRYLTGVRSMNKGKLEKLLMCYNGQAQGTENFLKYLLNAEINWTRVVSVEEHEEMVMYDLTTEEENFVAGDVPTLFHNTIMDGLKSRGEVIVIAATNRPDSIDPALRRPGRFDREIEFAVPDRDGREAIMQIHTRNMPLGEDKLRAKLVKELAALTHGYTGADISSLTKEAALRALRRLREEMAKKKISLEEDEIPVEVLDSLKVTRDDFFEAMKGITPSALREVFVERPNVRWDDVGGLEGVKSELREVIELPLSKPEIFEKMGIRPIRGVLMYGPPGTGKTMLAKAIATESEANFIAINGPEIFSKWVGESEKITREFFRKARQAAPCILFIDEIDAIAPVRGHGDSGGSVVSERVVDTVLSEMDGLKAMKKVVVVAATNRPDMLDRALLRAGRFDRVVEIPLPDEGSREEIFRIHTKAMPLKGVSLKSLATITKNFSGADIENLCREAGMVAVRAGKNTVGSKEFETALQKIGARIVKSDVDSVKKFKHEFGEMYR